MFKFISYTQLRMLINLNIPQETPYDFCFSTQIIPHSFKNINRNLSIFGKEDGQMSKYDYGTRVRARLHRLRRTQRQLAAALGYSPSYISMVLSGTYTAPAVRERITRQLESWERRP